MAPDRKDTWSSQLKTIPGERLSGQPTTVLEVEGMNAYVGIVSSASHPSPASLKGTGDKGEREL